LINYELKRLLVEIKNIKVHTNNNIKQYIYHRCFQVTKNIFGNPKSLDLSLINLVYRLQTDRDNNTSANFWNLNETKHLQRKRVDRVCCGNASIRLQANENWRALLLHTGLTSL